MQFYISIDIVYSFLTKFLLNCNSDETISNKFHFRGTYMFKILHLDTLLKTAEDVEFDENSIFVEEENFTNEQSSDWFRSLSDWFSSLLQDSWKYISNFYDTYGEIGVITALIGIFVVLFAIWLIVRLIEFIIRKRRRKKLRELRAKYAAHVKPVSNTISGNTENSHKPKVIVKRKKPPGDNLWENEVRKAVANDESLTRFKEDETKKVKELISGNAPYKDYVNDVENDLFTLEGDIHDFVEKISAVEKTVLLNETVKLRVGLEKLNIKISNLKKLATAYPDDDRIGSLIELCEAFVKGSKGVEQGYITALNA